MGYGVYEDRDARDHGVERWAGYRIPAVCDMPDCEKKIDRGLGYKCEGGHFEYDEDNVTGEGEEAEAEETEEGCGLYFCEDHRYGTSAHEGVEPKPDILDWVAWMLTDSSWGPWRREDRERRNRHYARFQDAGLTMRDAKRMALEADS